MCMRAHQKPTCTCILTYIETDIHKHLHQWYYSEIHTTSTYILTYMHTFKQVGSCSGCAFYADADGTLTRSPDCNPVACKVVLSLYSQKIRSFGGDVFEGMYNLKGM